MSCEYTPQLDINDLESQLKEARKGVAKVDKKYVDYDSNGHLFEYDISFDRFLSDVDHILKRIKIKGADGERTVNVARG